MHRKLLGLMIGLLAAACLQAADGVSEPVEYLDGAPVYGEQWPAVEAVTIGSALATLDTAERIDGVFSGTVTQVCQTKGCWMVIAEGDRHARVMSAHKFFLPKDYQGRALVAGELSLTQLEEKHAKHIAQDYGDKDAPVVMEEFRVAARSVVLLDPLPASQR